ncbi:MAG TPA: YciI family protein [Thermoanaerobaculia bacterium]|nr:YciI family protein [Thermoanaerobaculia bacterium]
MEYLLLIYSNEKAWSAMARPELDAIYGEYHALTESLKASGTYKGGNPLQATSTATTVRVRGGKTLATDGPFAETKEQLGGYYLVDAKDLDEALAIAARIPSARMGSIEVRPIQRM